LKKKKMGNKAWGENRGNSSKKSEMGGASHPTYSDAKRPQ